MASERILTVGKIEAGGEVQWHIAALKAEVEVVDGELQRLKDESEALEDYRNWLEDVEFWRKGQW